MSKDGYKKKEHVPSLRITFINMRSNRMILDEFR